MGLDIGGDDYIIKPFVAVIALICILDIAKIDLRNMLSQYHITWKFPTAQIILIIIFILLISVISVISPLKRIKEQGISEAIGSL